MKKRRLKRNLVSFIKGTLAIGLAVTCVKAILVIAEGEEGTEDEIILNRPKQSSKVRTDLGDPEQTKNDASGEKLPDGYEVLLGEDGVFRVTYTIDKDCDDEYVYIDLNKAMEIAKSYCGQTDSTWLEPGDTRVVQFYIKSDSNHIYKYVDGSFALTTPNYGTNQTEMDENGKPTIGNPSEGAVVGFDKQELDNNHKGKNYFELATRTEPMIKLLGDVLNISESDIRQVWVWKIDYDQALKLNKYLGDKYGTDNLSDGLEAYLVEYYSDLDGVEYTNFVDMMGKSAQAIKELYSGTSSNRIFTVESKTITNQNVAAGLKSKLNASSDLNMMKTLASQKTGNNYSEYNTLSKLKTQLQKEGNTELANLIPSRSSSSETYPAILKMYEFVNGEGSAYKDYLEYKGYNADDFKANSDSTFDDPSTTALASGEKKFSYTVDPVTRYNNFYQTLLSVLVAGSKDEVDAVTGGQSGKVQTVKKITYTVIDADDGQTYKNCVPAYELGSDFLNYVTSRGYPENTLACADNYIFAFGTQDGEIATTEHYDGEVAEVYESTMPEYSNDDWSTSNRAPQFADYMNKTNDAWSNANSLFKSLFESLPKEGITNDGKQVTAFMAFNLDGPLTGNDYQDTEWSWASSIKLERIDGDFDLNKVDDNNTPITDKETEFYLWKYQDGNKVYLEAKKNEDGSAINSWTNDKIKLTTTKGNLNVKYVLTEGGTYYVQEANAPKGYQLDNSIFVICDNKDYSKALENLSEDEKGKAKYVGNIDSARKDQDGNEAPLSLTVQNPKRTEVSVTKDWDDEEDRDGKRPDSVTVHLYADGEETGKTLILNEENGWKNSFKDLDKYSNGTKIVYTISENTVDGYTTTIDGNATDGYVITNSHTPETVIVSGSKTWEDNDNQDGVRPESITIRLKKNGTEIDSRTVTAENGWAWSFDNLAKYEAGNEVTYTITEDTIENYSTSYEESSYNVTNTHEIDKTSVTVTKAWDDANDQDGKRTTSVTVHLYADGEDTGKTLVLSEDNQWRDSFKDLDVNKEGTPINYTVVEDAVTDYETTITGDALTGYTITNSHTPAKTNVLVSKVWDDVNNQDGIRPTEINVHLLADGAYTGKVVTLSEDNGWAASFEELDVNKEGTPIEYTVEEESVAGYTGSVSGNANGYVITNSHTPETTTINGSKTWDDNNNQDGLRPTSITIKLMNGETVVDTRTVTEESGWTWSFENIAKNENGQEIVYSIEEEPVEGYSTEVDGYDVTNTLIPTETPEPERPVTPTTPDEGEKEEPKRPSTPTTPDNNNRVDRPSTPTTGDQTNNGLAGTMFVVSMLAVALLLKKKHSV